MSWFKATRASGEKCGPGEFCVEDSDGVEWQVTAVESKKPFQTIAMSNQVVCLNKNYECNWELRGDLHQSVRELIAEEERAKKPDETLFETYPGAFDQIL